LHAENTRNNRLPFFARNVVAYFTFLHTFYIETCALITQRTYAVPEDVVLQDKYTGIASDNCSASAFGKLQLSRMSRNFTTLFNVSHIHIVM